MESKTNWDYFCELMIAIPGLNSMFTDTPGGDGLKTGASIYSDDAKPEWRTGVSHPRETSAHGKFGETRPV